MIRIRPAALAATLVLGVGSARDVAAQESPLVIEAHGGAAIPLSSFANGNGVGEGTGPGVSLGVDIAFPGGGRWAPYVGFGQERFDCVDAGCAPGGRYVATGFRGGLRFMPFPGRSILPWARAGVVTAHVETGALGGANAGVSDLGVGGEVGAGVHIGGASQIALNPGARFVAVSTRLPGGSSLAMRYLIADLAVVLSF
jgi:hypothetical protein